MSADPNPRSIRYTATYKASKTGRFLLLTIVSDGESIVMKVDGKPLAFPPHAEGMTPQSFLLDLTAGQTVDVAADYVPRIPGAHFSLGIAEESSLVSEEAKKFASMADVAIVSAGFDPGTESEGIDRTFTLPWGQDALIEAVAAANSHTVVTLTGGGAVDTHRWLDKVSALLHTWYPGQEGGTTVADVLFGKQNPEGRLPMSFDRVWEENPSFNYYYPVKGDDTILKVNEPGQPLREISVGHVKYGDKLMVGYRYWTTAGRHPLFPFGYGLSYTTFSFSNLQTPSSIRSGSEISVSFDVTNTGSLAGATVGQLYVSDPSAKAERPERELKGFEKVHLAPGETKHVTIGLDARAFSYWDEHANKWTIDPGRFVIRVGDSSENTPLHADVVLQ
jgi:beta-glucosidase